MNEYEYMKLTNGIDESFVAEYTDLKPKKRISAKRWISLGIVIAATLALSIPVGAAYTRSRFSQKQSVQLLMPESKDAYMFEVGQVMENEHLRLTIDLLVSDGHNVMTISTQEYKDEVGKDFVRYKLYGDYLITYTDGSNDLIARDPLRGGVPVVGKPGGHGALTDNKMRLSTIYSCEGVRLDKELRIIYFSNNGSSASSEQYFMMRFPELDWKWVNEYPYEIDNILEGCEFVTSFAPNVESITLSSTDGTEITMSQFELYCDIADAEKVFDEGMSGDHYFILKNGERKPFKKSNCMGGSDFYTFGEIINLNDYEGVELNGKQFLRK